MPSRLKRYGASSLGLLGGMLERLHLAFAPDELRQTAAQRALQPRAQRSEPGHLVYVDWLADTFDPRRPERLQREISFHQPARAFGDYGRARIGQGLHPRGEIGSVADWCVLDMTRTSRNRAHHHLSGVRADPNLNWRATVGAQQLSVVTNFLLHTQCRL